MSRHVTKDRIDALKARISERSKTPHERAGSPEDDLGAIGISYWKDRALRAESRSAALEARLEGVLSALRALDIEHELGNADV